MTTSDGTVESVGCPSSQEWCATTPSMTVFQMVLGFVVTAIGYPTGVTLIQTLYSKILGPRPQVRCRGGVGCLLGCLRRSLGWGRCSVLRPTPAQ